jgi:hypothetical protein
MTEKKNRPLMDYSEFLFPGETLAQVDRNVLRKRKHDRNERNSAEDQLEKASTPDCIDWFQTFRDRYSAEYTEMQAFILTQKQQIRRELEPAVERGDVNWKFSAYSDQFPLTCSGDNNQIDELVERVIMCVFSYSKNNWIFVRRTASGYMVGGLFLPADFGNDLIPLTYYYGLKNSPAFVVLYNQLLPELDRRYGQNQDTSASLVKQELAGTYRLPANYLPWWKQPKPVKVEEVKPEVKSYRTTVSEEPPPPTPAPVYEHPNFTVPSQWGGYSTRNGPESNLAPEALKYLAGDR